MWNVWQGQEAAGTQAVIIAPAETEEDPDEQMELAYKKMEADFRLKLAQEGTMSAEVA